MLPATIQADFLARFPGSGTTRIIRAPGRLNLIGEHTDYNDGLVLPMAIEPAIYFACRARNDGLVRIASTQFPDDVVEFSLLKPIEPAKPTWANYCRGIAHELLGVGIPLVGMDALITNTLPVGGGLSSSAAMLVGTGLSLLTLAGQTIDPQRMALLAQRAEHTFANVPSGIMDQTIVACGKAGTAMMLDCRDQSKRFVPLDPKELRIVVINSMVKHELSGGEYRERREQCEAGVAILQKHDATVKALRDATMTQVDAAKAELGDVTYRRCRHVVTEITRVTQFVDAIQKRFYEEAGQHMLTSHASMKDDYEITTDELDFLVEEAMKIKGVYGARMTGGGFGGCVIALVQPRAVDLLSNTIRQTYKAKFNIDPVVFDTAPSASAVAIELNLTLVQPRP